MDFRKHQAFTLIELMIAVAIVGILASIAMPAYQNYRVRAVIAGELLPAIHNAAKNASEYFLVHGNLNGFCASADGQKFISVGSDYVDSFLCWEGQTGSRAFHLQARVDQSKFPGDVPSDGRVVMFPTTDGSVLKWHCGYHAASNLRIPDKYLPGSCRQSYINSSAKIFVDGVELTTQSLGG